MNNHDSEKDFLNELYQQSALEKPPAQLDKKILELAKANHERNRFAMTMNLQRVLSVAAVMVLSVYIFFEVGGDHSSMLDENFIYPQQKQIESSQPVQQLKRLEVNDEVQAMQGMMKKEAKRSAAKEKMNYMSDQISELASEAPPSLESDMTELSSPQLIQQKSKTDRTLATSKAEDMLQEIRMLLASGKVQEATILYGQLKRLFPEYPVPKVISDAIEVENNQVNY